MFVILSSKWTAHPFLKNSFIIKSYEQIDKIREYGIEEVLIDTRKGISMPQPEEAHLGVREDAQDYSKGPICETVNIVPEQLKEAVSDRHMEPEKKAKILYWSSLEIMSKLLADPKAENISQAKSGIFQVVDSVFSEDMALHLIKLMKHDFSTYTHSVNVGMLSLLLSKILFKDGAEHDMHELGAGFFLHDIGKARTPQEIINKAGMLTEQEWEIMKNHPAEGFGLLSETGHLSEESRIITMQHHEKENGTGYPLGLKGDEIFLYARICRIADVFDALTSIRPYHKKRSTYSALQIMKSDVGFEKGLFDKFVRLFEGA